MHHILRLRPSYGSRSLRYLTIKRVFSQSCPVYLQDQESKSYEYNDLNTMYSKMFDHTNKCERIIDKSEVKYKKEIIDELNGEFNDLCNLEPYYIDKIELEKLIKESGRFVVKSNSTDPFYNLALEQYIFRETPKPSPNGKKDDWQSQRLLLYVNDKCAVIGKNQNVWKEVFLRSLREKDYKILRRYSGGGAVVHDLGNLNYSYISSRAAFDMTYFGTLIVNWLHDYSPDFESVALNNRGDLVRDGKKIGGSAYKIAMGKAYHHGTILVNSNLADIKSVLKPKLSAGVRWTGAGVESVRSSISNLGFGSPHLLMNLLTEGFKKEYRCSSLPVVHCDENTFMPSKLQNFYDELQSEHWLFSKGPDFSIELTKEKSHTVSVKNGIIVDSSNKDLLGTRFLDYANEKPEIVG